MAGIACGLGSPAGWDHHGTRARPGVASEALRIAAKNGKLR
jgi:hypothetical protein